MTNANEDPVTDPILDELRSIRTDLNAERASRKLLQIVVGAIFVVVLCIGVLSVNAYVQRNTLRHQTTELASALCVRGNELRGELRSVLIQLIETNVHDATATDSIVAQINDPNSPLAARPC